MNHEPYECPECLHETHDRQGCLQCTCTNTRCCSSTRYDARECSGAPVMDVVYISRSGAELDRHAACTRHAVAEENRHIASAGMARIDLQRVAS